MLDNTFIIDTDETDEEFNYLFKSKARKTCEEDAVRSGLTSTQAKFKCKKEMGGGVLFRGAKKVSLAIPRGAALTLINLNYRAFATRMARAKANEPLKYRTIIRKWNSLGGNTKAIERAMNKGKNKKMLICGERCKEKFDLNFDGISEDEKAFFDKYPSFEFNNAAGLDDATIATLIATGGSVLATIGGVIATVSSNKAELESDKISKDIEKKALEEAEKSNRTTMYVVGGIIGVTILTVTTLLILKKRKNK